MLTSRITAPLAAVLTAAALASPAAAATQNTTASRLPGPPTWPTTANAVDRVAAAQAQSRYYASFGQQAPQIDKVAAARAQSRYYASFRHSEPLTPPRSQSGGTPWVLLVIGLATALLVAAAVTIVVRGPRVRRRAARVSTSA